MPNKKLLTIISIIFLFFATAVIAYPVAIRVNANLSNFYTRINKCNDADCTSLDYSSNQTINSGGTTNQYAITGSGSIHTGEFDYKSCYLPHLYIIDTDDSTGAGPWDYNINFVQKAGCSAAINYVALSQSTINKGQAVTITANVSSAFTDPGTGPKVVPDDIRNIYSADTNVTLVVKNSSGSVVYTSTSLPDILMSSTQNISFVYTPNLGDTYTVEIITNATDCACAAFTQTQSSTTLTVVNNAPTLGNITELPTDLATYLKNGAYQFNITVNDADGTSDISMVILEWTGSNQTITTYQTINSSAREYYASRNDLAVGTYSYKWFANDSQNSFGNVISDSYTVNQATPRTFLLINDTSPIEKGRILNITSYASDTVLSTTIWTNYTTLLTNITPNISGTNTNITDTTNLALGLYQISANTTGNANYTDNSTLETIYITIQDTIPPAYSANTTSPLSPTVYSPAQNYQFNITWSDVSGVSSVILEFNGTNYTTSQEGSVYYRTFYDLPANETGYRYRWYANDSVNLWNLTSEMVYLINKAPTLTRLFLNSTEGNRNYAQNDIANFTVALNASGKTVYLDTNITGWTIQSGTTPLYNITNLTGLGIYNITGYFLGDENYTASSRTYYATTLDVTPPLITMIRPLNQTYQTSSIELNFTLSETPSWIGYSLNLAANQTTAGNTTLSLNQGIYNIRVFANDSSNNMNVSDPVYFSVACLCNLTNSSVDGVSYPNNLTNILTGVSTLTCSNITNSTITNSTINNSYIKNVVLEGMVVKDAIVDPPFIPGYAANSTIESNSNVTQSFVIWSNVTNWSNVTWSMVNYSWIDRSNVFNSTIGYSIVNQSNVRDSIVNNSNIIRSSVNYSTIYDSNITDSIVNNSNINSSSITNSTVLDSNITNSNITLSNITNSTVIDSNITNSTVKNSYVINSTIVNSNITNMQVYNANITDGILYWGTITYGGTNYTAPPTVDLDDIYNPPSGPGPGPSGPSGPGGGSGGAAIAAAPSAGLSISLVEQIEILPGTTQTFDIIASTNLINASGVKISISQIPFYWTVSIDPSSVDIPTGGSKVFTATITIPADQLYREVESTVTATSNEGITVSKPLKLIAKGPTSIVSNVTNVTNVTPTVVPNVTATAPANVTAGPAGYFLGLNTTTWAGVVVGIATIAGGIYILRKKKIRIHIEDRSKPTEPQKTSFETSVQYKVSKPKDGSSVPDKDL